ncbi:MAG: fumarylacetoacetate hydrolase family protein, partial [archaeon]|nr:fumarylacetoacetate hydrolase family protein [archaeon]
NMELPDTPKLFIKPSTSVIGTNDNIIKPNMSNEIDYEGELAIVIGKKCKNVEVDESNDYIFGYTVLNDVTARDVQRYDEQWTRGKSFDTFAPIGPVIETDLDPQNQKIKTTILKENTKPSKLAETTDESKNKELIKEIRQDSNTSNMVFSSYELVSFISKVMTLNPGDVIATGTPPGVGQVKVGEIVEVEIEDIGILSNKLVK